MWSLDSPVKLKIEENSDLVPSVSKRVLVQNLAYRNDFNLLGNQPLGITNFHINDFARRLVSTPRKWPNVLNVCCEWFECYVIRHCHFS